MVAENNMKDKEMWVKVATVFIYTMNVVSDDMSFIEMSNGEGHKSCQVHIVVIYMPATKTKVPKQWSDLTKSIIL